MMSENTCRGKLIRYTKPPISAIAHIDSMMFNWCSSRMSPTLNNEL